MLDGAEGILRDEGYAALTSRAVAERCGVKQRLVYYYFQTMDELIVETFRRMAVRELERPPPGCRVRGARHPHRPAERGSGGVHRGVARGSGAGGRRRARRPAEPEPPQPGRRYPPRTRRRSRAQ